MFGRRGQLGSQADRATFRTLHTASLMTGALRHGLTETSAEQSVKHMRALLSAPSVGVTDLERLLAWDGQRAVHGRHAAELAAEAATYGGTTVAQHDRFDCGDPQCPLRQAIIAPLTVEDRVVGTLQVYAPSASAARVRAATEVARWVSGQLELGELESSRRRLMAAEVRALRAQISPHFIYNSLTAIASFVRTDPDRARELLLDFADFTRYSFRQLGDYTTLEEELQSIVDGKLAATVEQFPYLMGYQAIQGCVAAKQGKSLPAKVNTPTLIVTKDNAQASLDATPAPPKGFTIPDPFGA